MAAGITIGTFTLASGVTAGVFASLSASVTSATISVLAPNDGTVVEVQTSAGTGTYFPAISGVPHPVTSELYLKNNGSSPVSITAKIVTLA